MAVHLALAGVGELTLVDRDVVSRENLHRQPVYALSDIGKSKAEVAAGFLSDRVPGLRARYRAESIDDESASEILRGSDLAVDCLDNMAARRALNSACVGAQVPLVHTGGIGWEVSEAVFWSPGTACLECLFPRGPDGASPLDADALPSCEQVGALGAVTGLVASLGAIDAIKLLIGEQPASLGKMLVWDGRSGESQIVRIKRRAECGACGKSAPGRSRREAPRKGHGAVIELCGGKEFYIRGAFPPGSFPMLGMGSGGRRTKMGESIIQATVGDAEVSLFRTGGVLVKGVSSADEARRVARAVGADA